jgi:signal transduction histidine kinase
VFLLLLAVAFLIFRIRLRQIENARLRQQNFSKQLINAQETERQRIAAELHDSIGQDLLIIRNRALLGLDKKSTKTLSQEQLAEISETAAHALDETRTIARNLRPQYLQRFGLTQTLQNMIEQVASSGEIEFQSKIDEIDELFSQSDELSIFRIVQESLNNIVKHSQATVGKIEISRSGSAVKIFIYDNGKGFQINSSAFGEKEATGFGLTSIVQRVKILGGNIKIDSEIGNGTTLTISLNIQNQ